MAEIISGKAKTTITVLFIFEADESIAAFGHSESEWMKKSFFFSNRK